MVVVELGLPVALLAAPLLLRSRAAAHAATRAAFALAALLHAGIALGMNGAAVLSAAAVVAWLPLVPRRPLPVDNEEEEEEEEEEQKEENTEDGRKEEVQKQEWKAPRVPPKSASSASEAAARSRKASSALRWCDAGSMALLAFAAASLHFEFGGAMQCTNAKVDTVASLLHNRWNVFAGSDTVVVWEIMPGQLADGSVVDVWRRGAPVDWAMPQRRGGGGGLLAFGSSTTTRGGRWRSFPLASSSDASEEELEEIYSYFCREWNNEWESEQRLPSSSLSSSVSPTKARSVEEAKRLVRFKAFMLQAPLAAPDEVSKRLLREQSC